MSRASRSKAGLTPPSFERSLTERRARAQERRVVPESIARFIKESAQDAAFALKPARDLAHTFQPGRTPPSLRKYEREPDWRLADLANRYPRLSTDRETAEKHTLEWVTPGHPLFEALRRHSLDRGLEAFARGACFHSLAHDVPARLDFYRARVADGLGQVIHERLFTVELTADRSPRLREPDVLGDMSPTVLSDDLPPVATLAEPTAWGCQVHHDRSTTRQQREWNGRGFGGGYLVAALVKVGGHPDATGGVERRDAYLPRRSV